MKKIVLLSILISTLLLCGCFTAVVPNFTASDDIEKGDAQLSDSLESREDVTEPPEFVNERVKSEFMQMSVSHANGEPAPSEVTTGTEALCTLEIMEDMSNEQREDILEKCGSIEFTAVNCEIASVDSDVRTDRVYFSQSGTASVTYKYTYGEYSYETSAVFNVSDALFGGSDPMDIDNSYTLTRGDELVMAGAANQRLFRLLYSDIDEAKVTVDNVAKVKDICEGGRTESLNEWNSVLYYAANEKIYSMNGDYSQHTLVYEADDDLTLWSMCVVGGNIYAYVSDFRTEKGSIIMISPDGVLLGETPVEKLDSWHYSNGYFYYKAYDANKKTHRFYKNSIMLNAQQDITSLALSSGCINYMNGVDHDKTQLFFDGEKTYMWYKNQNKLAVNEWGTGKNTDILLADLADAMLFDDGKFYYLSHGRNKDGEIRVSEWTLYVLDPVSGESREIYSYDGGSSTMRGRYEMNLQGNYLIMRNSDREENSIVVDIAACKAVGFIAY